jgi:hypothetical protein
MCLSGASMPGVADAIRDPTTQSASQLCGSVHRNEDINLVVVQCLETANRGCDLPAGRASRIGEPEKADRHRSRLRRASVSGSCYERDARHAFKTSASATSAVSNASCSASVCC